MKPFLGSGFGSLAAASAIVVAAAQPTLAAPTQVTGVDVKATSGGIELQLQTRFGDRPQVFAAPRGNSWVADVINTQLRLPSDGAFQQSNPAPGIAAVQILPLDENSIRIIVTGTETRPDGEILSRGNRALTFAVKTDSGVAATPAQPSAPITAQGQIAQPQQGQPPAPATDPVDVLVPSPKVTIDGEEATPQNLNPAPPFLPRAVAPPVGDIAVSELNFQPTSVDLGTAVRIPRLVLRDAPAREVLSLLARAAGLNLAFSPAATIGSDGQAAASVAGDEGPLISLDVENEPVQDVFNAVLRLSALEANRNNNTIFVSPRLPNDVKDIVIRTYRLNQATATSVAGFLTGLGAEQAIPREERTLDIEETEVGGTDENEAQLTTTQQEVDNEIDTDRIDFEDSIPILRGVQVVADERTNSVTVVGPRNLVSLASAKIAELDLRRRQVAVNIRVLDIDLSNITRAGNSFSFGVGGTRFLTEGGIGVINVDTSGNEGSLIPASPTVTAPNVGTSASGAIQSDTGLSTVVRDFVTQLQANIQNGNAKVLTDPTIVVQEGQTASVALTEEVVTNFEVTNNFAGGVLSQSIEIETDEAGLIVAVQVDRIDDNGFVSMSLSPSIRGIAGTQIFDEGTITLLTDRRLSTGTVRLRDGQGLVMAGIIQDEDLNTVSKVPILGDLPILGSLFRSTTRTTQRNEVIIIVTPQILDDSDRSTFGYAFQPSGEARRALDANTLP